MSIRVVVADDHPMFRFGLRAVLDQAGDIEVVGEAADGQALLALVASAAPDVVLTDLSMEGVDGVRVIETLARQDGGPPVIALTMHADDTHIRAALRAGARGYLLKGATGTAIAAAVRAAACGHDAFDPSVTRRMVAVYAGPAAGARRPRADRPGLRQPRDRPAPHSRRQDGPQRDVVAHGQARRPRSHVRRHPGAGRRLRDRAAGRMTDPARYLRDDVPPHSGRMPPALDRPGADRVR
jgi:DNA-binding NarL/FixJ family response regulator